MTLDRDTLLRADALVRADALLRAGAQGLQGDPADFVVAADHWLARGELELAASALDRAFGLAPNELAIVEQRRDLLEQLRIVEHDLVFRYVPAGTFVMGSTQGDPDERPVHPVMLAGFWITDVPITWAAYCELMGWAPPPASHPPDIQQRERMLGFHLNEANKIRARYCWGDRALESLGPGAVDPDPYSEWIEPKAMTSSSFTAPRREGRPIAYDHKPMVAIGWADAEALAERLGTSEVSYALPSEAQWEKAARGGLIGKRYSWGDEPPTRARCDFGNFGQFTIANPRSLPSNGYGLHGMCGGVWEWTSTLYDALAYADQAAGRIRENEGRSEQPDLRVLRGGSWADGAAAVTVSMRIAREGRGWQSGEWSGADTPNVGFRLIRLGSPP